MPSSLATKGADGQWYLELDDPHYKTITAKIDEFRSNNRDLNCRLQEAQAEVEKYKGVDPEKYRKAMEALEILQDSEYQKLIAGGKLDEVVERRVSTRINTMKSDFESQIRAKDELIKAVTSKAETYKARLGAITNDQAIQIAVSKHGRVRPGAMDDVLFRGRAVWQLDNDGIPVARRNGEPLYGKDSKPLPMDEWAETLMNEAPHLFESRGGGGASPRACRCGMTR
jgi:hypothetical protein